MQPVEFVADYELVVEAATLAGTTPAVLDAIGASAGRDFRDVVAGEAVPDPPSVKSDPRIYVADATVRAFLADYYRLRANPQQFASEADASEADASEADASEADASEADARVSPQALPDIGLSYRDDFAFMLKMRAPAEVLTFVIQSLCKFVLTVARSSPTGMAVAKSSLQSIVQGVRRLSKPGQFDWAIFSGERELLLEDELAPDQVGDVGEDVEAVQNSHSMETISGDNIDYDTSENNPNNEP